MPSQFIDQTAYKQLPAEAMPEHHWQRFWINLLGTVTLVFALNLMVILYFQNDTQNRGDYIVREKWRMVNALTEPLDWLVLGDSSANQGIDTAILRETLGGQSANLALIASWGLVGDAWLLQAHIERVGPPGNVIIGHVYNTYPRPFVLENLGQSSIEWRAWNHFSPQIDLSLNQEFDFIVTRYFPLYHRSLTLEKVIERYFTARVSLFEDAGFYLQDDGYMLVTQPDPKSITEDSNLHLNAISGQNIEFQVSEINQQALDEIIRLADVHQINIYFVNSPLYDQLYINQDFQTYFAQLEAWIIDRTSRSSYVHYIDTPFLFPADELERVDHTYDASSRDYTYQIVGEIEKVMSAPVSLD